jgi:hypothetical protein
MYCSWFIYCTFDILNFTALSHGFGPLKWTTIFARNYGTAAVISYNLKGIAPPVPPIQCCANKNLMSGCATPTLKRVGGGRVENMYQEMVYYNRMHVKTRLSQSILSKIVCWSNTITLKVNLIQLVDIVKLCTQLYFHNFFTSFRSSSNFVAHG